MTNIGTVTRLPIGHSTSDTRTLTHAASSATSRKQLYLRYAGNTRSGANYADLLAEISDLRRRVASVEQALDLVDEMNWDEALVAARGLFASRKGEGIYPTELADILGTSVSQAVELCEALEKEGAVVVAEQGLTGKTGAI